MVKGDKLTSATLSDGSAERLTSVWVHKDVLFVGYEDGFSGRVSLLQAMGKKAVADRASTRQPSVSDTRSAVVFRKRGGGEFHVDALAIRSLIDPMARQELGDERHRILGRVGERIRSARMACGLSLRDAADRAELGADTLADIEDGRLAPKFALLRALAAAFGLSLQSLLGTQQ